MQIRRCGFLATEICFAVEACCIIYCALKSVAQHNLSCSATFITGSCGHLVAALIITDGLLLRKANYLYMLVFRFYFFPICPVRIISPPPGFIYEIRLQQAG